jgi:hypothetical protein
MTDHFGKQVAAGNPFSMLLLSTQSQAPGYEEAFAGLCRLY